jgi:capsular exopolysaccharide synthesis family protein
MGRIDKALSHTSDGPTEIVAVPGAPPGDVFESPWSFEGGPSGTPGTPGTPDAPSTVPTSPGTRTPMALFRGFNEALAGRIVATPSAPPVLAERFRRLAASLHHAQLVQGLRTVMVTSADPGDGKTLTSANLALTLSESYRRQVLLIDADLRRPSLHDVFNVPNVHGLNEGLKSPSDARLNVIKISDTLTLLPAGRPDPDPMSSLTSTRMAEILQEASQRFEWIIIDTAPLGLLADASLLSRIVDRSLLVIRAGQTPHASVARAVDALGKDHIIGVVLNAVDAETTDGKNYYYTRTQGAPEEPVALPTREG